MEREVDVKKEEEFLAKLRDMHYGYLLWNEETLLLYRNSFPISHPDIFNIVREGYKALEGIDLGVDGIVKHFSYSSLAKFIDYKQPNCQVGRFLYGRYYKGCVDYDGMEKIVTIKNWQLSLPGHDKYEVYPPMLYNDINITRCDQRKRRPNVARLIGYSIDKILAAVYDLRPKCTLNEAIFENYDFGWKYRVRAAVGVGRAIESFHQDGIVVGCIDAEWMLLDEDFNVHLCDFPLQDPVKATITKERMEAFRYLPTRYYEGYGRFAPECDMFETERRYDPEREKDMPTMQKDIYSYGILLLTLISKQKFGDICFHAWIKGMSEDELSNLVHESFLEVEDSKAKKITSLAVSCLSVDPLKRPKIEHVVICIETLTRDHLGHRDKIPKV